MSYLEFFNRFPLLEKKEYIWDEMQPPKKKGNINKISYYIGTKTINNNEEFLFVKEFYIKFNDLYQLLKEAYFNFSLKAYDYFQKDITILLSNDKEYLFIISKGEKMSLKNLIDSQIFNYKDEDGLTKWIIYQITFGLYILHKNNIIHHDIKSSNILVSKDGSISICDFGSAIFKNEESNSYTLSYSAPELLINTYKINEKYDMWCLGVLILELYLKKSQIFRNKKAEHRKKFFALFGVGDYTIAENLKNFKINDNIINQVNDKSAKNLIKNLLSFDPNKRHSAEDILKSDFLEEYEGIDSFQINKIKFPFDFEEISENGIDKDKFLELIIPTIG